MIIDFFDGDVFSGVWLCLFLVVLVGISCFYSRRLD